MSLPQQHCPSTRSVTMSSPPLRCLRPLAGCLMAEALLSGFNLALRSVIMSSPPRGSSALTLAV
eukprot:6474448-Amphidinium_carterae.4